MVKRKLAVQTLVIILVVTLGLPLVSQQLLHGSSIHSQKSASESHSDRVHQGAADTGVPADWGSFIVLELLGKSIPAKGESWRDLLTLKGIPATLVSVEEALSDSSILDDALLVVCDASIGSDNASLFPEELLRFLILEDVCLVLTGQSAWLLHLLREESPPSLTAPSTSQLATTPGFEGAVYLNSPEELTIGFDLTTEDAVMLPLDSVQTEKSRLIDLTGSAPSSVATLRYDSSPLDIFLYSPENPDLLTETGLDLLVNTIAYSLTLRENSVTRAVADLRAPGTALLGGGYAYAHEPTMAGAYCAVHLMRSLTNSSEWSIWKSENQALVLKAMSGLYVDMETEAGFVASKTEGYITCLTTAQGLWLVAIMDLTSYFDESKLIAYLSSRQDADGGFENHLPSTYHTVEALSVAGMLSQIDTATLESWLRSLVIDGTKTSDPDLWGAIAPNPTSANPTNQYAAQYILSLDWLGTAHNDPLNLASWIVSRTSVGDGSFRNTVGPSEQLTIGTASALTTMVILGTLGVENRTSGLAWLESSQLDSGGFGLGNAEADLVGKAGDSRYVGMALEALGERSSETAVGLKEFVLRCRSDVGFEQMQPLPSLMWSYWASLCSRLNHVGENVNNTLAREYLDYFTKWTQYPFWGNLTTVSAPEYGMSQYMSRSVWTNYFGAATAMTLGLEARPDAVSDALNYISMSQGPSGHFRPAMIMGTAHIQSSVAAVETLYLLDSLDVIPNLEALESAMLSDYVSGSWSLADWTLNPFAGDHSAIDWLCTRAALRLGLVDATIAAEIAASIESRVQYSDLVALSRDVATLALLNSSGFDVSLDDIDTGTILAALGPTPFEDGWFNASVLWQPIFTAEILEMISILGLRPQLYDAPGSSISASTTSSAELGDSLILDLSVTSSSGNSTILTYAFGRWLSHSSGPTGTATIPVPEYKEHLGPADVFVVVSDWSISKAFDYATLEVVSEIEGYVDIDNPSVLQGNEIGATVSWTLSTGHDAGLTNITVRLGNPPLYEEWDYQETSPATIQIPTQDFGNGNYNLTVLLSRESCAPLEIRHEVEIVSPIPTYIVSPSFAEGTVGLQTQIDWSLRFASNGSEIGSQVASLVISNEAGQIVYVTEESSQLGGGMFYWTPLSRGNFTYIISYEGNESYVDCSSSGLIHVYDETLLVWETSAVYEQYSTLSLSIKLETSLGAPVPGQSIHITVTNPLSVRVVDEDFVTNSTGYVTVLSVLSENGAYALSAEYVGRDFLRNAAASKSVISWSSTILGIGGIGADDLVGSSQYLWARLADSALNPVAGELLTVRIVLLPSTMVEEQFLMSNSTGHVLLSWSGATAGLYELEVSFGGTISRDAALESLSFSLYVPVTLTLSMDQDPEVGVENWVQVTARDHLGSLVSGLSITIAVSGPTGFLVLHETGTTTGGLFQAPWTPLFRGLNNVSSFTARESWYEEFQVYEIVGVHEEPRIQIDIAPHQLAPSDVSFVVSVVDYHEVGIAGVDIHVYATVAEVVLLDAVNTTLTGGSAVYAVRVDEPGELTVAVSLSPQEWLLEVSILVHETIKGVTSIELTLPGTPVEQGTTGGILVTLTDWSGAYLVGAVVSIVVAWSNGTDIEVVSRVTGLNGICSLAHTFDTVGDFSINASYAGIGLNSSTSEVEALRVYVIPSFILQHDPSCMLGDTTEIQVGITDAFGQYITGRTLFLTITQDSSTVLEEQVSSVEGLHTISWSATDRGVATITLLHAEDLYYYTNSTDSSLFVLEVVTADLSLTLPTIDLFGITSIQYILHSSGTHDGVPIHIEVLDVDLIPVWSSDVLTNASGYAVVHYQADHAVGILTVRCSPVIDQFLMGGDRQEQLNVMTSCDVSIQLSPEPPCSMEDVNMSIGIKDQLGEPIDSLAVTVSLYDSLGQQVKLGSWSYSITVTTSGGHAFVPFVPEMAGLYLIHLTSSGTTYVHGFILDTLHTVYSRANVSLVPVRTDLEVGDSLETSALLVDHLGIPMEGRNLTLLLEGPGPSSIGPVTLLTNATGYVSWTVQIEKEGLWLTVATFEGLGVYLPDEDIQPVNVKYNTEIQVARIDTGPAIAGQNPVSLSVLLVDSDETPLEGFTISYVAYHDQYGPTAEGSFIQQGQEPMLLNITLVRMGNYSVILTFDGTTHYHGSSAAIGAPVLGTTTIDTVYSEVIERSDESNFTIQVLDETSSNIGLLELDLWIGLFGEHGSLSMDSRSLQTENVYVVDLRGLPTGNYIVRVNVSSSSLRVGCAGVFAFRVEAETSIMIVVAEQSGVVSEEHSLTFVLADSLGDNITGVPVYVSVHDPDGREIYGSPLTVRTALECLADGVTVAWTPLLTGVYTVSFVFEASVHLRPSSLEVEWLIRRSTFLEVEHLQRIVYGESATLTAILIGGISRLQGAPLTILISMNGIGEQEWSTTTGLRGRADFVIEGLLAGNHSALIAFNGTQEFLPSQYEVFLLVEPRFEADIIPLSSPSVGTSCMIEVSLNVIGVDPRWKGTVDIILHDSDITPLQSWSMTIEQSDVIQIEVFFERVGEYTLAVEVSNLPVLELERIVGNLAVSAPLPQIPLDNETVPLLSGIIGIGVAAGVLRRKLNEIVGNFPSDWT